MADNEKPELALASRTEKFAELIAVVTSAAPWIGGPVAAIIGGVATNLKIKRVTEFVQDVLQHIEALRSEAAETFVKSEDFSDILEKTSQAVADELNEEKRRFFSNYILNNISQPEISYNVRLKCLRLLSQVDTRHIDLLKAVIQAPSETEQRILISSPATTLGTRIHYLQADLDEVIQETNTLGLTSIRNNYLRTNMTGFGAADLRNSVTSLGREFMSFISEIK